MIFNKLIAVLDRYVEAVDRHADVMSLVIPAEVVQQEFVKYLTTTPELLPYRTQRVQGILAELGVAKVTDLHIVDHARALLLLKE